MRFGRVSGKKVNNKTLLIREIAPGQKKLGLPTISIDIFLYGNILTDMPRAATASDAFNAIGENHRREILGYLANDERTVGEIVAGLRLLQPSVSKHLRVLREVGLVRVRRNGRHMLYRTNSEAIRPLYEWTKTFERFWSHQLLRVKERAEVRGQEPPDTSGI